MSRYKFTLLDICTPDYFLGHSGVVFSVLVDGDTSKEDLTRDMCSEYNCYDLDNGAPDLTNEELEVMCDKFILKEKPFEGILEKATEDTMDSVYMYFTVEEI